MLIGLQPVLQSVAGQQDASVPVQMEYPLGELAGSELEQRGALKRQG